jgi:hypothetical protein
MNADAAGAGRAHRRLMIFYTISILLGFVGFALGMIPGRALLPLPIPLFLVWYSWRSIKNIEDSAQCAA